MHEVTYTLSEEDNPDEVLEDRTPNCMAWFTGLMLPGKSMPFILMNALSDCDPDTPKTFHDLPCTEPNVGFQYRGHTYWSWECIVGKVLGASQGVNQIAGWLGPCISSPDLDRAEVAKINQQPARNIIRLTATDVKNMQHASNPLGQFSYGDMPSSYRVDDYDLITPDGEYTDTIRIERLNFTPVAAESVEPAPTVPPKVQEAPAIVPAPSPAATASAKPAASTAAATAGPTTAPPVVAKGPSPAPAPPPKAAPKPNTKPPPPPEPITTFDAAITFAIHFRSWKVNLRYDTPFIAAYPCQNGPHVLFKDYIYHAVKVDSLVKIEDWGPRPPRELSAAEIIAAASRHASPHPPYSEVDSDVSDDTDSISSGSVQGSKPGAPRGRGGQGGRGERPRSRSASSRSESSNEERETLSEVYSATSSKHGGLIPPPNNDLEEVLVVEAFGVNDNEVFARAWCSFWGTAAIMGDLRMTCLACCVREAYAVGVSVVVLTDSKSRENVVEEVDRKMEGL